MSLSLRARVAVASAVTVDRDAVAEPGEEGEMSRRSVWEERCRGVGRAVVECGCLGDRTENSLHRTDVVPAKRSTALRMKIAGWCMECIVRAQVLRRGAGVITQIFRRTGLCTRGASASKSALRA